MSAPTDHISSERLSDIGANAGAGVTVVERDHLLMCTRCREERAAFAGLDGLLTRLPRASAPADFATRALARFTARGAAERRRRFVVAASTVGVLGILATAVVVLAWPTLIAAGATAAPVTVALWKTLVVSLAAPPIPLPILAGACGATMLMGSAALAAIGRRVIVVK